MKYLRLIGFLLLTFLFLGWMLFSPLKLSAAALPIPEISCLEVLSDGSVIISWINVDNTVQQQNIYYSNDQGGTYSRVGFLDIYNPGISSFHHTTADANVNILHYYVEIVYPAETVESAPARTMHLLADENPAGTVVLSWNDNLLPGDYTYEIWQSLDRINYIQRGDILNQTLYNDVLQDGICNDSVFYRIEVANAAGCRSISSVFAGKYSETRQPLSSLFDSISVNATGEVVLSWTPSVSTDAINTIIYLNNYEIASIPVTDPNQSYIDASVNPCIDANLVYALAAEDNCGNKSTIEDSRTLSPVFVQEPVGDVCKEEVFLQWNPYINANPPLEGYQILYSLNGDPFVVADEVDANTTSYIHEQVLPGEDYTYAIRAKFGGITSTSCRKLITTGSYLKPTYVYLANASVMPDGLVELTLDLDLYPTTCQWKVWRTEDNGTPVLAYLIDRQEVSTNPFVFTDTVANGNQYFYDYQLEVIDSCQKSTLISNAMTTMHLTGTAISNEINQLNWTAFSGFDAGVKQYYIYRMADGIEPTQPIDSVLPGVLEYTEDLNGISSASGIFTYWIAAEENPGNTFGFQEKSLSNRITFAQKTDLFMPNAFRPGGVTPTFKPVFIFFNGPSYLFQVYNRWGQLIFETNQATEGWDGEYQGRPAPTGTFLYRLVYQDFDGKSFEQRGAFTLVR